MCFNLSLHLRREKAASVFGTDPGKDWGPGFLLSAFDHPVIPVLGAGPRGLVFQDASWGLIPPWAGWDRGRELRKQTLNARSEEMWVKPSFRESARKYRILIPFTGFFEWKAASPKPVPHFFRFKEGEGLGALAGIAAPSPEPGGPPWTFSLLTGSPNSLVAAVHPRSPLRLFPDQWAAWVDPGTGQDELAMLLCNRQWPDMESYPVGPLISQKKGNRNVPEVLSPRISDPFPVDGQLGLF